MYSSCSFPTFSNIEDIKVTKCEFVFLRRFLFLFLFYQEGRCNVHTNTHRRGNDVPQTPISLESEGLLGNGKGSAQ